MFRLFHAIRRDEDGQSLVIACIALLILALGVMTTVNLGRAVHQRIGLQQTADASAYSMAVMEARTFNFYAFTNRAQIAHYVSAMTIQSYISLLTFIVALITEFVAMLMSIDLCKGKSLCEKAACLALDVITEGLYAELDEFITELQQLVQELNQALTAIDKVLALIPADLTPALNYVMYGFAKIYSEAMLTGLTGGAPEVVDANDDQVSGGGTLKTVVGALTSDLFSKAHQKEAGGTPLSGTGDLDNTWHDSNNGKREQAKRAMAEVANASRHIDELNFLTDRDPLDALPIPGAAFLEKVLALSGAWFKMGQTKLTTVPLPDHRGGPSNCIHTTGVDHGQVPQGNVLGADDIFFIGIPLLDKIPYVGKYFKWGEQKIEGGKWPNGSGQGDAPIFNVSVWADKYSGEHFRPNPDNPWHYQKVVGGLTCTLKICCLGVWHANYVERTKRDGENHMWKGITPFMNFDVTGSQSKKGQELFYNQPSTWSVLEKTYDQSKLDKKGGPDMLKPTEMNHKVATPEGPATIDTTNSAKVFAPFKNGAYNVLSRGLAYYHRSRNWEEPPNFFNPYWRAKLDPVMLGMQQAEAAVPGGNALTGLTGSISGPVEKILVH